MEENRGATKSACVRCGSLSEDGVHKHVTRRHVIHSRDARDFEKLDGSASSGEKAVSYLFGLLMKSQFHEHEIYKIDKFHFVSRNRYDTACSKP